MGEVGLSKAYKTTHNNCKLSLCLSMTTAIPEQCNPAKKPDKMPALLPRGSFASPAAPAALLPRLPTRDQDQDQEDCPPALLATKPFLFYFLLCHHFPLCDMVKTEKLKGEKSKEGKSRCQWTLTTWTGRSYCCLLYTSDAADE